MPMDYEWFKAQIYAMSDINLSSYKEKQMKRRIDSLIKKNNIDTYEDYVRTIKANKDLYNEFINYLTINVSEFYRNPSQWEVLKCDVLPMLLKKNRNLNIWSAACSTGDEPYTLAMMLADFMPMQSIKIHATDIDKQAIEFAKKGVYYKKSLEGLPKEYINKYFFQEGDYYRIKDEVKNCVDFRPHNLLKDKYPENFDLIVCRNVLIYFTEDAKAEIYERFNKSLKSEAILFVGSTEQIIMSAKYGLKPYKTFFYMKEKEL